MQPHVRARLGNMSRRPSVIFNAWLAAFPRLLVDVEVRPCRPQTREALAAALKCSPKVGFCGPRALHIYQNVVGLFSSSLLSSLPVSVTQNPPQCEGPHDPKSIPCRTGIKACDFGRGMLPFFTGLLKEEAFGRWRNHGISYPCVLTTCSRLGETLPKKVAPALHCLRHFWNNIHVSQRG